MRIRRRKPWVLARRRLLGWNVRFDTRSSGHDRSGKAGAAPAGRWVRRRGLAMEQLRRQERRQRPTVQRTPPGRSNRARSSAPLSNFPACQRSVAGRCRHAGQTSLRCRSLWTTARRRLTGPVTSARVVRSGPNEVDRSSGASAHHPQPVDERVDLGSDLRFSVVDNRPLTSRAEVEGHL